MIRAIFNFDKQFCKDEKVFVKYFVEFWNFYLKDRIAGAVRPRKFCLVTDITFLENMKIFGLMEALMIEALQRFALMMIEKSPDKPGK